MSQVPGPGRERMLNTRKRREAGSSKPSASKPTRTPGPASGRQVHECQMRLSLTPTPGHLGVEVARLWRRPCRRGERAHPRKAGRRPEVDGGSWDEVPEQGQVLIRLNADEGTGDEVGEAVGPGLVCSRRDWL